MLRFLISFTETLTCAPSPAPSLDSVKVPSLTGTSSSSVNVIVTSSDESLPSVSSASSLSHRYHKQQQRSFGSDSEMISKLSLSAPGSVQTFHLIASAEIFRLLFESPLRRPNLVLSPDEDERYFKSPLIPTSPLLIKHDSCSQQLKQLIEIQYQTLEHLDSQSFDAFLSSRSISDKIDSLRTMVARYSSQTSTSIGNIMISHLHADQIACQLTIIDWSIFVKIHPQKDLHLYADSIKSSLSIQASTDFFNYLTRSIEYTILSSLELIPRSQTIHFWIKVATKLFELRNFSSLKAVLSGLSTKIIQNLRKSWDLVSKKSLSTLDTLSDICSERENYRKYREYIGKKQRPLIPFLGVVIHDITYISAARKMNSGYGIQKFEEVIAMVEYFQNGPDYLSDPKLLICSSKEHNPPHTSFKKDREPCSSEKHNFACDPLFCCHFILTIPYLSEKEINNRIKQEMMEIETSTISRSASPKKFSTFMENSVLSATGKIRRSRSRSVSSTSGVSFVLSRSCFNDTYTALPPRIDSIEDEKSCDLLQLPSNHSHHKNISEKSKTLAVLPQVEYRGHKTPPAGPS